MLVCAAAPWPPRASMSVAYVDPNTLLVVNGYHLLNDLWKSMDDGYSWTQVPLTPPAWSTGRWDGDIWAVDGHVYFGFGAVGVDMGDSQ